MTPLLVTVAEAATMLGFKSRDAVYRLIRDGELEQVHIGTSSRVVVDSLHSYVARLRDETPSAVAELRRLPKAVPA